MRRLFLLSATLLTLALSAQKPVTWSYSTKNINDSIAELVITASIQETWHLYSQFIPENGPIPTTFSFKASGDYALQGGVKEGKAHEEYDANFDMVLKYFENQAVFTQRIQRLSTKDFVVKGELEFMTCDDHMCLPPEYIDMEFKVKGAKVAPKNQSKKLL